MLRILGAALIAVFLWGCFDKEEVGPDEILIGELLSLTGTEATFGVTSHRGIQMAVDEENAAGKIHGRKLRLVLKDTNSSRDKTRMLAEELIKEHNVFAIIGETSSDRTKAAAMVAQLNKVPLITGASTNPSVTAVGDYIFRACYIDPFQGSAMAKFAFNELKLRRIAVLKDQDSNYSLGLAEYFIDGFVGLGGEIVYEGSYLKSSSDYNDQLRNIKQARPDAVFIPGYYAQVADIIKQAVAMRIPAKFLGGDGWDSPDLNSRGGDAVVGSYYTNHFSHETNDAVAVEFVKKYKQIYGTVPDGTAATGYDAAKVLIAALRRVEKLTRENVRNALAETKNHPGVTGSITLDGNRNAVKPIVVLKVGKEKHTYLTTIAP